MKPPQSRAEAGEHLAQALRNGAGRDAAFRLFELYYHPIQGFFMRRGLAREEANDLAQDSFVRVFRSIRQFRQEVPFEYWLFQIVANVWRNELRQREARRRREVLSTEPESLDRLPDSAVRDPLTRILYREESEALEQAITTLPPQMGRCFVLRVTEELEYEQIARIMNISVPTARVHVHQARRKLREALRDLPKTSLTTDR